MKHWLRNRKLRSFNIVLNGFSDMQTEETSEVKKHDTQIVSTFIADLGLEIEHKSLFRLGKKNGEHSKRPLIIAMSNEQDKKSIMSNLGKLNDKTLYKGISVTDDHTMNERNIIKTWVEKAKQANANEDPDSGFEWKVRGTPKNGMSIKKLRKRVAGS